MTTPILGHEWVQSVYRRPVGCNLSESSFHPLKLPESFTAKQLANPDVSAASSLLKGGAIYW